MPLGVRDFLYLASEGIVFIGLSDMKITSRIDAYLTNATFPWEKESGTHVTVGALLVYRVTRPADYNGEWKFDRLWVKSFPVQTNVLCWNSSLKMLAIGMDDGSIHCLRISTDHKYMQYEEYCTLKLHAARVMGLAIDAKKNWILSVAEDKKFKVADLSYQEAQAGTSSSHVDIQPDMAPLKNLEYDEENQRVFILSGSGQLFIYSLTEKPPKLVRESETGSKSVLRDLSVDYVRNYIFTCTPAHKHRRDGRDDICTGDRKAGKGPVHEAGGEHEGRGQGALRKVAVVEAGGGGSLRERQSLLLEHPNGAGRLRVRPPHSVHHEDLLG